MKIMPIVIYLPSSLSVLVSEFFLYPFRVAAKVLAETAAATIETIS
jgi:hypothetical protein